MTVTYNGLVNFTQKDFAMLTTQALTLISPDKTFDYRIPALVKQHDTVYLLFDARPRAAHENWQEIGGFMPEDLPNPNKLMYMSANVSDMSAWTAPRVLPTPQAVCGDAAITSLDNTFELLYVASDTIGYFGSTNTGDKLHLMSAWGTDLEHLAYASLDDIYTITGADGIFATSGSATTWDGNAAFALVTRTGSRAAIYVAHIKHGRLQALSEPIQHPTLNLDETALTTHQGKLYLSCRIQAQGGRINYASDDGIHFTETSVLAGDKNLPDPGCNACLLTYHDQLVLIHPHDAHERTNGCACAQDGRVVPLVAGAFGYSDYIKLDDGRIYIVYERENSLMLKQIDTILSQYI